MRLCPRCSHAFESKGWTCPDCGWTPPTIAGRIALAPDLALADEAFPAAGFDDLVRLEAGSFWFRARNALLVWALNRYFPTAKSLLEVGCGTGFVLSGIEAARPELELYGSEIHAAGLERAAARVARATLFQMDARKMPFRDEFDVIGAFDVLEHIPEDTAVLDQMYRALVPGGGILITVPQHAFLWSRVDEYSGHVRRYAAAELRQKVEAAGFGVERMTSFVSLLLPAMLASRLRQRADEVEFDPTAEYRVGPRINRLLERVLGGERWLIRRGVDLPLGGSLLVAARKPVSGATSFPAPPPGRAASR